MGNHIHLGCGGEVFLFFSPKFMWAHIVSLFLGNRAAHRSVWVNFGPKTQPNFLGLGETKPATKTNYTPFLGTRVAHVNFGQKNPTQQLFFIHGN